MLGGKKPLGYTIIEVMIFLAVSGVMFVIAAGFIDGKQADVEFHNSVNQLNSNVSAAVDDVQDGFYPSNGTFSCNAGAATPGQGTNSYCIFLGKAIDFNDGSYNVVSVAGNRVVTGGVTVGASVTSLSQADPVSIKNGTVTDSMGTLSLKRMCVYPVSGSVHESYGIAILSDLNADAQSGTSGATVQPLLYTYSSDGVTPADRAANSGDGMVDGDLSNAVPLSKAIIYFSNGRRDASITISNGDNLTTSVDYLNSGGSPGSC